MKSFMLSTLILLLSAFGLAYASVQSTATPRGAPQSATVVLAVDLRELTPLRDLDHSGDVYFRRMERGQNSGAGYDLAIKYSTAAEWKSLFGPDENRAPHIFRVEAGTYVIEKIDIGAGPTTAGPGIDAQTRTPRFGSFVVREGEVLNLGRLIVHMHWREGYFSAKVEDNTSEVRNMVVNSNQALVGKLQTRLLRVVTQFPFRMGSGRL